MALATQCPHCHTTFRVAQDQLKLRAGLVRCGSCKQIFNGIEHLLPPEEVSKPEPAFPPKTPPSAPSDSPHDANEITAHTGAFPSLEVIEEAITPVPETAATSAATTEQPVFQDEQKDIPLQPITSPDIETEEIGLKMGEEPVHAAVTNSHEPLPEIAIENSTDATPELSPKTTVNATQEESLSKHEAEYEEPSFIRQGRRRQRVGPLLRAITGVGLFILLVGLLTQMVYLFHNQTAARFPQTKPLMTAMCSLLKCQIELPTKIDAVSLESSELQALSTGKNTFSLTALLRNHGSSLQAWPYIELTLNDANEKPVVRRIFAPQDYLPSPNEINLGFPSKSERSVKVFFELSQLKASGYQVYLFYP